ncbi:MAG: hypothetical protein Q8903_08210 [Bacteroidota bacterium]|nr:hypothetical protein [Bacteroidota bacterium]
MIKNVLLSYIYYDAMTLPEVTFNYESIAYIFFGYRQPSLNYLEVLRIAAFGGQAEAIAGTQYLE